VKLSWLWRVLSQEWAATQVVALSAALLYTTEDITNETWWIVYSALHFSSRLLAWKFKVLKGLETFRNDGCFYDFGEALESPSMWNKTRWILFSLAYGGQPPVLNNSNEMLQSHPLFVCKWLYFIFLKSLKINGGSRKQSSSDSLHLGLSWYNFYY